MKAIQIDKTGDIDVLKLIERDLPSYNENEVLIEMKAAGLNFIDIYFRTGFYKIDKFPYIPGKEGAGIVKAVGRNVQYFKPGDRVAFCSGGSGSYAEFAVVPEEQVIKIPDNVSFDIAAAVMLQGLTAYYLTHLTFPLEAGQTSVIHAGAGGTGLLLIQMAKLLNSNVITTVSTEAKAQLAQEAGADHIVLYTKNSFFQKVMQVTQREGADVVYDSVGKTTFDDSLKSLRIRGMLVSYGQSSGEIPSLDLSRLAAKSLFLTRPVLFHYIKTRLELTSLAEALFGMLSTGKLHVKIGQQYPLKDAGRAQMELQSRKTIGKSILQF